MKKFKVTYKEPVIHKEAIESHKNFDQLLNEYRSYKSDKISFSRGKLIFGSAVVVLSLIGGYLLVDTKLASDETTRLEFVEQEENYLAPSQDIPSRKSTETTSLPTASSEGKGNENLQKAAKPAPIPAGETEKQEEEQELHRRAHARESKPEPREENPKLAISEEEVAASFMEAAPKKGMQNLYLYFNESLIYPKAELNAKVEGTVILSFLINKEGRPENIEIVQSVSSGIDKEAERLIEEMPDWAPAQVKGKAVSSRVTLPITFKITE